MNITVDQMLQIIGEQAVEIRLLQHQVRVLEERLQSEPSSNGVESSKVGAVAIDEVPHP